MSEISIAVDIESNISLDVLDIQKNILSDVKFLKGLFILDFVEVLLSLFEIGFFLIIIEPQEKQQIIKFIENNKNSGIFSILNKNEYEYPILFNNTDNLFIDSLDVLTIRENGLNLQINNYAIGLMSLIIILLFVFLIVLVVKINALINIDRDLLQEQDPDEMSIRPSVITGLMTIIIIGLFQYNMYQFGLRFQYPGSNEIMNDINIYIASSFNVSINGTI